MSKHDLPLDGIRVLDFTHVLAGPFCTYQLAVMGADVIKIESPERADMMRFNGPDFALAEHKMGLHFQTQASNKRALSLDLKHPDATSVLKPLIADADVMVVNYRKSAAEKLSIDYNNAKQINPNIIYCSLTGYGQTGPKADHPAYDNVIQAFSGLMAATGTEEQGPVRVGPPVLDYGTGAQAAMAVVSSLYQRERTGEGNFIDIAMLDAALMLMSASVTDTAITGKAPARPGNRSVRASYGCYKTKSGGLMLGAYTQQQMVSLWTTLGKPEKAAKVEQLSQLQLDKAYDEDEVMLTELLLARSAEEWEQLLNDANVPAARLRTLNETLKEPHLQSRSVMQKVEITNQASSSLGGHISVPVAAWQSERGSPRATTAPPAIGEHTREILREIGFDNEQIESLCQGGGATYST